MCVMEKEQAKKKIEEKWMEIENIYKNSFDVEKYKIKIIVEDGSYKIDVVEKDKRRTSTQFVIKYVDQGKEIVMRSEKRNGANALVDFITLVGVDKVFALNVKAKREGLLISESVKENEKKNFRLVDNKYIFIKSENDEKIRQIKDIIDGLQIGDIASVTTYVLS